MISERAFRALVAQALEALPEPFRPYLDQVEVVVEDAPESTLLEDLGIPAEEGLYGLYEGPSLPERHPDQFDLPSRIILYRLPLSQDFPDPEELREEILTTVLHEFAHHLGIEDDRLDELGWE